MTIPEIIARLERETLWEDQGDAVERAYRRGHNAAKRQVIDLLRQGDVMAGLRELRSASAEALPVVVLDLEQLDDNGGEDGS